MEQINLLCRQLPIIIGTSLLTSVILVIALWNQLSQRMLAGWLLAVAALVILRLACLLDWRSTVTSVANAGGRLRTITLHSGLSGSLWGVLGFFAVSHSNWIISLVMIMVLTGMVASATASLSHFKSVYLAFVVPALTPAIFRFSSSNDPIFIWIALLILLYLIVSIVFARGIRATLINSITLRFENLDLINDLSIQNTRVEEALHREEQANHSKSRFLAASSHDLRQPLHALRLFTATLQSQSQTPRLSQDRHSNQHEIAENINAAVTALEELFDGLLDISRLDAGTLLVDKQHFRLDPLIERIGLEHHALAKDKGLSLRVDNCDAVVHTDPQLLERLLRNLANNALRYTVQGGVQLVVQTRDTAVSITVSDTGCGIEPENQNRIFEEFVQLNNPSRDRTKGIGLGLSIVRRISDLLNIDLTLHSEPGTGTEFTLDIPVGDASLIPRAVPEVRTNVTTLRNLFVVVIDDEIAVQTAMTGMLLEWECNVLTAD